MEGKKKGRNHTNVNKKNTRTITSTIYTIIIIQDLSPWNEGTQSTKKGTNQIEETGDCQPEIKPWCWGQISMHQIGTSGSPMHISS